MKTIDLLFISLIMWCISSCSPIDNMPLDDPMLLEDYTIDSRTKLARNMNMNTTKKVIFVNEDKFDQY